MHRLTALASSVLLAGTLLSYSPARQTDNAVSVLYAGSLVTPPEQPLGRDRRPLVDQH